MQHKLDKLARKGGLSPKFTGHGKLNREFATADYAWIDIHVTAVMHSFLFQLLSESTSQLPNPMFARKQARPPDRPIGFAIDLCVGV